MASQTSIEKQRLKLVQKRTRVAERLPAVEETLRGTLL